MLYIIASLLIDIANREVQLPDVQRHVVCIQILDRLDKRGIIFDYHLQGLGDYDVGNFMESFNVIEQELHIVEQREDSEDILLALYEDTCFNYFTDDKQITGEYSEY